MTIPPERPGTRRRSSLEHLPTGTKLFLILSAALLWLALIGFFATLQMAKNFNDATRTRLSMSAAVGTRTVATELRGDLAALRATVSALDADPGNVPSCARAEGVFAPLGMVGTRFAILDARGRLLCGQAFPSMLRHGDANAAALPSAAIVPGAGIVLGIGQGRRHAFASAFFPSAYLATLARPSGVGSPFGAAIVRDGDELPLVTLPPPRRFDRRETLDTPLGIDGLTMRMQVPGAAITSSLVVALMLPWLMWAAAAGIGWFVVDRMLIRPLRQLRARVAAYRPGDVIDPGTAGTLPAHEIRELGDTFRAISRTVALHEAGLAEGLVRQTKLTREVHHRVKNNLQVISSLINIHARGSHSPEASAAYASIQRRVDALAVVHRHHFAESETTRGLSLRSVLGELASNIRATAPSSAALGIVLDADPFLVNQDVAVAVAFLVTETVELALTVDPAAQLRITVKPTEDPARALLRVSARALTDGDVLKQAIAQRYGRVMEGLSRQLRSRLHHDPLVGSYEIAVAVVGRD